MITPSIIAFQYMLLNTHCSGVGMTCGTRYTKDGYVLMRQELDEHILAKESHLAAIAEILK